MHRYMLLVAFVSLIPSDLLYAMEATLVTVKNNSDRQIAVHLKPEEQQGVRAANIQFVDPRNDITRQIHRLARIVSVWDKETGLINSVNKEKMFVAHVNLARPGQSLTLRYPEDFTKAPSE